MVDKEALEKQRLAARSGGYHKYEYIPTALLTAASENTPGYQPESGRFDTDAAAEDKRLREARRAAYHHRMEQRRAQVILREEQRWHSIEQAREAEDARVVWMRDHTNKAKRNEGSVPYDPITLTYHEGMEGDKLRAEDDSIRYRAAVRARMLHERNISEPYNPVTGTPLYMPPAPVVPSAR